MLPSSRPSTRTRRRRSAEGQRAVPDEQQARPKAPENINPKERSNNFKNKYQLKDLDIKNTLGMYYDLLFLFIYLFQTNTYQDYHY